MAIDNEAESVLDLIESDSSDHQLKHIISFGITHPLYEARWQVAELIYRRQPIQYVSYFQQLAKDPHPYVKKRAMNCINKLSK